MKINSSILDRKIFVLFLFLSISFVPAHSQQANGIWVRKADMPTKRWYPSSCVYKNQVYVIGGIESISSKPLNNVEVYDPSTDKWISKSPMPTPRTQISACIIDDKIYVIGGSSGPPDWTALTTVEMYNPLTDSWETRASMNIPREELSVVAVDGRIYAIGGVNSSWQGLADVEIYNPKTNTWTKGPDMPTTRGTQTAVVIGKKIYVIGGTKGTLANWEALPNVEILDTKTNKWTAANNMKTPRSHLSGCLLNGKIYTLGGSTITTGQSHSIVESFDPKTGVWQSEPNMLFVKESFTCGVVNGKIYTFGGTNAADNTLTGFPFCEEYIPYQKKNK